MAVSAPVALSMFKVTKGVTRPEMLGVMVLAAKVVSSWMPTLFYQSASISAELETIKGMIDMLRNCVIMIQMVDLAINWVLDVMRVYPTKLRIVCLIMTFITITKTVSRIG